MQLEFRPITLLQEALRLAPELDRQAALFHAQFSDREFPHGAAARHLAHHFDEPESLLLVARPAGGGEPVGLCLVGPFVDLLSGERLPMVLVLHVVSAARHQGVARGLIEQVRSVLRSRGIARLAARAGHNDDALISMGERWGFVRTWELMLLE